MIPSPPAWGTPPTEQLSSEERLLRRSEPTRSEIPCNFLFCLKDLVSSRDLAEAINGEQHSRQHVYFGAERQPYPYLAEIARHI